MAFQHYNVLWLESKYLCFLDYEASDPHLEQSTNAPQNVLLLIFIYYSELVAADISKALLKIQEDIARHHVGS